MKKKFVLICILLFCVHSLFAVTYQTSDSISFLSVNGYTYLDDYYDVPSGEIVEITPINDTVCKMVYTMHLNKACSIEYITVYLKKGDIIRIGSSFRSSFPRVEYVVKDFDYNKIVLNYTNPVLNIYCWNEEFQSRFND